LLTAPERDRALVEWNQASPTIEVAARPINEWFDAQAIRFPTAIAVRFEETTYTYAELQARANQLAQFLIQQGVGIEEPVGILLERSAESVVAILGILKSGAAYVPLDTTYPTARIQQIIEEARVRVVLTESALHAQLPAVAGVTAFTRETIAPQLDACPATTPVIPASPDRMMYVLFTSGSTGRPKGVAVTHRTYHNYLREILLRLEVEAGWHYGLVSTFAADLGTTMLYGALCSGGTLHVLSYTRAADPTLFAAYCARYPLDVLKLVPSHFEAFTAADILPRHRLIFAGEACAWSTVAKVRALRPDLVIQNHYGPTETTVAGLTYVVPTPLPTQPGGAHLPLGERLGNIRAYVLNDWLEPLPVGIPGEL
jgi:non-ribosomal peptide synthetase component F